MGLSVVSLVVLALALHHIDCWKPISNSAAYSLHQTFPDFTKDSVSRSAHNQIKIDPSSSVLNTFKKSIEFIDNVSASVGFAKAKPLSQSSLKKIKNRSKGTSSTVLRYILSLRSCLL